ncbi:MAG: hypothetical protein ABW121_11175 [Candidatus Thiodiazotropha sp. 6PLUC7]
MNDIIEGIFDILWHVLKITLYVFIWNIVLFNLGRFSLLLVTLGQFPRTKHLENNANLISITGLLLAIALWMSIAIYNNWGNIVGSAT